MAEPQVTPTQANQQSGNQVSLDDKYTQMGEVYISGTQALVRLPILQQEIDASNGLKTAGYISGYRGSPLGTYDSQLQRESKRLQQHSIQFLPGVNEDLAATAVWGTQQVGLRDKSTLDGVFGIWYGKGPGVDRTGDVFKHANLAGTAKYGGVLALLGDDHTCESSTTCHQSELGMVDAMIPVLNPSGVQEIIEFGLHGWSMSRYSGCWVALKCVHDTVSSTATVTIDIDDFNPVLNELSFDGVLDDDSASTGSAVTNGNIRLRDSPREQEARLHNFKIKAVQEYCRANQLDRIICDSPNAKIGIFTTGKSYLDVKQALIDLNIDQQKANELGLRVYKLALVWPIEPQMALQASNGLSHILVVEEKRDLIESQLKNLLYGQNNGPMIIGKTDEQGQPLFRSILDLDSHTVAINIAETILNVIKNDDLQNRLDGLKDAGGETLTTPISRSPYFCAGCPHNRSTVLPEGSRGMAGIGCAWMSQSMDRNVDGYCQMGGEGATWIGEAPFSSTKHIFQNLGDGTYFHSGSLAIRAAVASKVNITYKILYNDAVAMTGGQGHDGELTPKSISWQVFSEGVAAITVVTDEPEKYTKGMQWAPGVTIHHRDELDQVQQYLRTVPGTSVLIYDQTCAAEKRRRRKRKQYPDPAKRLFINSAVCEGCGDCGQVSNCTALVPLETSLGRKRSIDQSACNKDYSCVDGFCPSFVTVYGGALNKPAPQSITETIPDEPEKVNLDTGYSIAVTGVGGTGVVTVGALLGMAAHIEGKGSAVLDMTGLAQKGGAVTSHIRLAATAREIGTIRIAQGGCDLILGCDSVVTASEATLNIAKTGLTKVLLNTEEVMPGDFTASPDLAFPAQAIEDVVAERVGQQNLEKVEATRFAVEFFADAIAGNLLMLGFAYQRGLVPLTFDAINQAIALNGTAIKMNQAAFLLGRQLAAGMIKTKASTTTEHQKKDVNTDLSGFVDYAVEILSNYQNKAYADNYRQWVEKILKKEQQLDSAQEHDRMLTKAVARYYFKLLAYKDEYEVARLYSDEEYQQRLKQTFAGNIKLKLNLAPPLISRKDPTTGHLIKREFGSWIFVAFNILRHMKIFTRNRL